MNTESSTFVFSDQIQEYFKSQREQYNLIKSLEEKAQEAEQFKVYCNTQDSLVELIKVCESTTTASIVLTQKIIKYFLECPELAVTQVNENVAEIFPAIKSIIDSLQERANIYKEAIASLPN